MQRAEVIGWTNRCEVVGRGKTEMITRMIDATRNERSAQRRIHCVLPVVRRSQKFSPRRIRMVADDRQRLEAVIRR